MAAERFGPYAIESPLGRGGMGEVHRAVDVRKGRAVALKRLPAELTGDPTLEARFRRESEVAARLTDPHVIPIHDYGQIDGRLFLDMRLVEGVDLAVVLRTGVLAPPRAVAILGQVAGALDAAHAAGLVHRDVKPSNILLAPRHTGDEDFVYLIDFGVAAGSVLGGGRLTSTGVAVGTAAYMAPERFTADTDDDPRSDVYALGCVFFEMLTGHPPFGGHDVASLLWQHAQSPAPRVSRLAPVTPALDAVIARALAKDPSQRFPRAGDLAEAARRALHGAPSGPASPAPSPAPWPTPSPWAGPAPHARPTHAQPPQPSPYAQPPQPLPDTGPPAGAPPVVPSEPQARTTRRRSALGTGVRIAGNVTALVVNAFWLLAALGVLALTGGTQLATIGVAAVGGGIVSAIVGLGARGRLRSRYTLLAWGLLGVSVVVVISAAVDAG